MGLKVLVTGASSGIGRATALRFSKEGHDVFATARSDSKLSETIKLAEGLGGPKVHKGVGDVGVTEDVVRHFEEAKKALGGRFDVVVLNAGVGWSMPIEDHTVEDYDKVFNTNVRGVFLWLKYILPVLKEQGSGQIVIINSVGGLNVMAPGFSIYSASKFALTGLAEGLRMEVQGTGIKVASVFPATVDTGIWDAPEWERSGVDVQKFGIRDGMAPEDIADVISNIVNQNPRADIDKVVIWQHSGNKK